MADTGYCKNKDSKQSSLLASGLLSESVQVRVGNDQKPFHVHKDILCVSSPFFHKACTGPWKEAKEGIVELPEDDPQVFEIYTKWLYSGIVDIEVEAWSHVNLDKVVGAYEFGDKILDAAFKNSLVDLMIDSVSTGYPAGFFKAIDGNLPRSSCFRRLYVDMWAWSSDPEYIDRYVELFGVPDTDFLVDLWRRQSHVIWHNLSEKTPWIDDRCQYHEHPDGAPKCSGKEDD